MHGFGHFSLREESEAKPPPGKGVINSVACTAAVVKAAERHKAHFVDAVSSVCYNLTDQGLHSRSGGVREYPSSSPDFASLGQGRDNDQNSA